MSRLHESLKLLSPTSYSDIPSSDSELKSHLQNVFSHAQYLIDSVPPPEPDSDESSPTVASSRKDVTSSSARIEHSSAIKELHSSWGKPVKLSAKENPLGMAVYKMSAKDKHGAWFARRSVLQGIGFARFKKALGEEFERSLETHGKPGEGAVRGIGAEKVIEEKEVSGAGEYKVMHLAAQFPGPTTPRDFLEMIMTTTETKKYPESEDGDVPDERCYMIVSQPVTHDDMPEKKGMIRGTYESIEFIREIRSRQPKKVAPSDIPGSDIKASDLETNDKKERNKKKKDEDNEESEMEDTSVSERFEASAEEAISQGKTVSLKPAKDKDSSSPDLLMSLNDDNEYEPNPVEWIMITRSEPGGNVPKFMVERGTPAQIVADAGAFLEWACKNHTETGEEATHTNGTARNASVAHSEPAVEEHHGILGSVVAAGAAAVTTVGGYIPSAITDRIGFQDRPPSYDDGNHTHPVRHRPVRTETVTSDVSSVSWLSAEDFSSDDDTASKEALFHTQGLDAKLAERKAKLDAKLFDEKERISKDKTSLSEKDEKKIAKAEEKHTAAITKANEQHDKDLRKYQAKHEREVKKAEEKIARERAKSVKLEEKKARDQERSVQAQTIVSLRMENERLTRELSELREENARLSKHISSTPSGIVALRAMQTAAHQNGDTVSVHSSQSTPPSVPL